MQQRKCSLGCPSIGENYDVGLGSAVAEVANKHQRRFDVALGVEYVHGGARERE